MISLLRPAIALLIVTAASAQFVIVAGIALIRELQLYPFFANFWVLAMLLNAALIALALPWLALKQDYPHRTPLKLACWFLALPICIFGFESISTPYGLSYFSVWLPVVAACLFVSGFLTVIAFDLLTLIKSKQHATMGLSAALTLAGASVLVWPAQTGPQIAVTYVASTAWNIATAREFLLVFPALVIFRFFNCLPASDKTTEHLTDRENVSRRLKSVALMLSPVSVALPVAALLVNVPLRELFFAAAGLAALSAIVATILAPPDQKTIKKWARPKYALPAFIIVGVIAMVYLRVSYPSSVLVFGATGVGFLMAALGVISLKEVASSLVWAAEKLCQIWILTLGAAIVIAALENLYTAPALPYWGVPLVLIICSTLWGILSQFSNRLVLALLMTALTLSLWPSPDKLLAALFLTLNYSWWTCSVSALQKNVPRHA